MTLLSKTHNIRTLSELSCRTRDDNYVHRFVIIVIALIPLAINRLVERNYLNFIPSFVAVRANLIFKLLPRIM